VGEIRAPPQAGYSRDQRTVAEIVEVLKEPAPAAMLTGAGDRGGPASCTRPLGARSRVRSEGRDDVKSADPPRSPPPARPAWRCGRRRRHSTGTAAGQVRTPTAMPNAPLTGGSIS